MTRMLVKVAFVTGLVYDRNSSVPNLICNSMPRHHLALREDHCLTSWMTVGREYPSDTECMNGRASYFTASSSFAAIYSFTERC